MRKIKWGSGSGEIVFINLYICWYLYLMPQYWLMEYIILMWSVSCYVYRSAKTMARDMYNWSSVLSQIFIEISKEAVTNKQWRNLLAMFTFWVSLAEGLSF